MPRKSWPPLHRDAFTPKSVRSIENVDSNPIISPPPDPGATPMNFIGTVIVFVTPLSVNAPEDALAGAPRAIDLWWPALGLGEMKWWKVVKG